MALEIGTFSASAVRRGRTMETRLFELHLFFLGLLFSPQLAVAGEIEADLTISDAPVYHFPKTPPGSSAQHLFTVTHHGNAAAVMDRIGILQEPFSYVGGEFPGTGGTCQKKINPHESCTLAVQFKPTAEGRFRDKLLLFYRSYAKGTRMEQKKAVRPIRGSSAPLGAAELTISDAPLYDFGGIQTGNTASHTFIVTNVGSQIATGISPETLLAPYSFADGPYPGTGGTCTTTLAAGDSCTVVVQFSPDTTGTFDNTLTLNYLSDQTSAQVTRPITGAGTGANLPLLEISDAPVFDFGPVAAGLSSTHVFTVSNTGSATAQIETPTTPSSPFSYVGGSYPGTGGTCGATLAAGSTCTLVVQFTPPTLGFFSDEIQLDYTGPLPTPLFNTKRPIQATGAAAKVLKLSMGTYVLCATFTDQSAQCWGWNNEGQVGAGSPFDPVTPPEQVVGLAGPVLAAGPDEIFSCFILQSGAIQCIGNNAFGSLGNGTRVSSSTFVDVIGLTGPAIDIGSGYWSECALIQGGSIQCWGFNTYGQLGDGTQTDRTVATSVAGLSGPAIQISPALGHTCALIQGGTVQCWGRGGTLGNGTANQSNVPVSVVGLAGPAKSVASASLATCALLESGNVQCWGQGSNGELGNGTFGSSLVPVDVIGLNGPVVALSGGGSFCALIQGGTLQCWGKNFFGQLGNGTRTPQATPVNVLGLTESVVQVNASFSTTCAVLESGTVQCWGSNQFGEIGDGDLQNQIKLSPTPVRFGTTTPRAYLRISDAPSYNFGAWIVGQNSQHTFTVTNSGSADALLEPPLALDAPFEYLDGTYPGTGGTCTPTISPGQTCTLVVQFGPTTPGYFQSEISLVYTSSGYNQTATASRVVVGEGIALLPELVFSEGYSYDFAETEVGQTNSHLFTITNTGNDVANIQLPPDGPNDPFFYGGGTYPGTGGTCGSTLAAGASCILNIEFRPSSAGFFFDGIALNYTGSSSPDFYSTTISLTGFASEPEV